MIKLQMVNDTNSQVFGQMPLEKVCVIPKFKSLIGVERFVGFNLLSNPEKMPEEAFNIPASRCKAGGKMIHVKNSVCSMCYAYDRGRYRFDVVKDAMERRYQYAMNKPEWVGVMSWLINHRRGGARAIKRGIPCHIKYFRWFDSGDIQDEKMLHNICKICIATPNTMHWLPSKEWKIITKYFQDGNYYPENLTIRISGLMKNGPPPTELAEMLGITTSTVFTHEKYDKITLGRVHHKCPASKQDGHCGTCRACWSGKVMDVTYLVH